MGPAYRPRARQRVERPDPGVLDALAPLIVGGLIGAGLAAALLAPLDLAFRAAAARMDGAAQAVAGAPPATEGR